VREEVAPGSPGEPPVSLSIGAAACPSHGNDAETLIDAADRAM
jgi:GGDEF domain-containing protein